MAIRKAPTPKSKEVLDKIEAFIQGAPDGGARGQGVHVQDESITKTTLRLKSSMTADLDDARKRKGGLSREALIRQILAEWIEENKPHKGA